MPSRKGFGALPADEYGLIPVQVGTWGPLVFVNPDVAAPPLEDFLDGVPEDSAWLGLEDFRCTFLVSIPLPCNWKTLIDGFSETYHVQGIHREMLPMVDDVNGPQRLWRHHGKLEQPYGLPSPRLRTAPDAQAQWEGFVDVMGERIGVSDKTVAGPAPEVAAGSTWRSLLAGLVRGHQTSRGVDLAACTDEQVMTMQQYNLFPNVTVVAFPDLLSVVRARPGTTPDDCVMDAFVFQRHPAGDPTPRTQPVDVVLPGDSALPIGMVLNQDVENARRAQRGLHQPGCIRLTLSREECRILNLHRNLERWLSISPTEIQWHGPPD